jgi:hypothetical protein
MGLQIQAFNVGNSDEIDAAFATFARERPDALFVSPDPFFTVRSVASSRPWRDREPNLPSGGQVADMRLELF